MSLKQMSRELAAHNVVHAFVRDEDNMAVAKKTAKYKSIKGFVKSLKSEEAQNYANEYYAWIAGGREGSAPKADDPKQYALWKYIRVVCNLILSGKK